MGTAARLRSFRIRAGKTQAEMAESLGLNPAWYADLERRDGELTETLTIFQAMALAAALGVRLRELLDAPPANAVPIVALPDLISAYIAGAGITIAELEDRIGWELQDFMAAPIKGAAELPIAFFQAVARPLRIDWTALIPDEDMP